MELASVTVTGFEPNQTAKMHNALRKKAAPVGADAVLILNSGVQDKQLWATGVAIKYDTVGSAYGGYGSSQTYGGSAGFNGSNPTGALQR